MKNRGRIPPLAFKDKGKTAHCQDRRQKNVGSNFGCFGDSFEYRGDRAGMERMEEVMGMGERVAEFRKRANLTQEELAQKAGVTQGMIGQIERGTKTVSIQLAKTLAKVFEVDILDIIGRD